MKPGFYWVWNFTARRWQPAEWTGRGWVSLGLTGLFAASTETRIGPKIPGPKIPVLDFDEGSEAGVPKSQAGGLLEDTENGPAGPADSAVPE
jgi:hypothetical protein